MQKKAMSAVPVATRSRLLLDGTESIGAVIPL